MDVFDSIGLYFTSKSPEYKAAVSDMTFRVLGLLYMFSCRYNVLPFFNSIQARIDNVLVSAKKGFFIKNMIFLIVYAHAVHSGPIGIQNSSFIVNLLLLCDSLVHFGFYHWLRPDGVRVPRLDVLRQIIRNMFIANYLCIWSPDVIPAIDSMTQFDFYYRYHGFIAFIFGMLSEMLFDWKANASRPRDGWEIIRGGLYEVTVAPEQLARVIKWLGFYMFCGTDVAFGFFCYALQVAFGKAILIHEKNLLVDPTYMDGRKFVCPFIFDWRREEENEDEDDTHEHLFVVR